MLNDEVDTNKSEDISTDEPKGKNKRGRKPKNEKPVYKINNEQTKFFVDLSKDKESLELIFNLLTKVNNKNYGREITFKDLALFGVSKLSDKDLEKIKDSSLSEMEKVEKALDDYNKKNKTQLSMGEFLVKKLAIN